MEIIKDVEQGTDEWLNLRFGWITASRFKDVMAGGAGKTRKAYMYHLAAEILTGERAESYTNEYMEWGTQTEPQARAMYELDSGNSVDQVAFIRHDTLKAGCSPDGLIGESGLVEFKCPKTTTQIETFLSGKMPTTHVAQVQGQLWISEREWCDFVSFDPRINGEASYFCIRVERDEKKIKEIEQAVIKFQDDLFATLELLR